MKFAQRLLGAAALGSATGFFVLSLPIAYSATLDFQIGSEGRGLICAIATFTAALVTLGIATWPESP